MNDLSQLKICVQKPLPQEEHIHSQLKDISHSDLQHQKLKAAFYSSKLWPKGSVIKVGFLPLEKDQRMASWTNLDVMKTRRESDGSSADIDPIEKEIRNMKPQDAVKYVVQKRILPITDLNIQFVDDVSQANIKIGFDANGGSWSLLGTDALKSTDPKTFNLGWLDGATIMHEFGHVLGMIHEHQNPRGESIDWDLPKLYAWAKQTQGWDKDTAYRNIVQKYETSQINGSNFDPKSIMLYFFPASLTKDGKGTDINERLSPLDVTYIDKLYDGKESAPAFYKQVYGQTISSSGTIENKNKYIFIGIVVVILTLIIIYFIRNK